MLEPWIIEQIRRREEEARRQRERPQIELPLPEEAWPSSDDADEPFPPAPRDDPPRGVVIIGM